MVFSRLLFIVCGFTVTMGTLGSMPAVLLPLVAPEVSLECKITVLEMVVFGSVEVKRGSST
jgi:hypothetical protein